MTGWAGHDCNDCPSNWNLTDCSSCAADFYGKTCSRQCALCWGNATCSDGFNGTGQCICPEHFQGDRCDSCVESYWPRGECTVTCPHVCAHGGVCDSELEGCRCPSWWWIGSSCSSPVRIILVMLGCLVGLGLLVGGAVYMWSRHEDELDGFRKMGTMEPLIENPLEQEQYRIPADLLTLRSVICFECAA